MNRIRWPFVWTLEGQGFNNHEPSQVPVAHACNPSYSGGRDQEDHGLKPAQENSSQDPILKIPNTKKGWQSGSSGGVPA
jgi:hypothetical protein